jgi:hypothetical protein
MPSAPSTAEPTATVAAASPASPATALPPTAQVAPALLTLGQAADGSRQMILRLHPAELGTVQISIDRSAVGSAHVNIMADRAETLQALQRDQAQLHRALDQAGLPASGRTVTFHTAPIAANADGGSGTGFAAARQDGVAGNNAQGGGRSLYSGGDAGGGSGGQRQSRSAVETRSDGSAVSYRVGLDIIA